MLSTDLFVIEIDVILHLIFRLELGKIDFKAVFNVSVGFFRNCGVTSIMLFLSFGVQLFAFFGFLVEMRSARHNHTIIIIHAVLSI
jgi:hypothetical protein